MTQQYLIQMPFDNACMNAVPSCSVYPRPQTSLFESNWRTVTVFLIWVSETNLLLDQAGHVDVRVDWLDAHLARREGGEWNTFFQKSEVKFHILVRGFKPGWGMDTKSSLNTNSVNLERKFVRTLWIVMKDFSSLQSRSSECIRIYQRAYSCVRAGFGAASKFRRKTCFLKRWSKEAKKSSGFSLLLCL